MFNTFVKRMNTDMNEQMIFLLQSPRNPASHGPFPSRSDFEAVAPRSGEVKSKWKAAGPAQLPVGRFLLEYSGHISQLMSEDQVQLQRIRHVQVLPEYQKLL